MTQTIKEMTVDQFLYVLYETNENHIDFMDNMNGGDCDCNIHITLNTILDYCGVTHSDLS